MFGSTVLDVGIGLVLTYLFLSLVVTAANELWATFTRARATDLERGIRNLLDGKSDVPERWWDVVWRKLRSWNEDKPTPGEWSTRFFDHPLINALSQDDVKPCYVPSQTFAAALMYLVHFSSGEQPSSEIIAAQKSASDIAQAKKDQAATANVAALTAATQLANATAASQAAKDADVAAQAAAPSAATIAAQSNLTAATDARTAADTKAAAAQRDADAAIETANQLTDQLAARPLTFDDFRATIEKIDNAYVKHALLPLVEEARSDTTKEISDLKKLTVQIEIWFDHAMDRVSGWYIRRTKWFLFAIAIVFTAALNVDTVAICRRLGKDDTLRASVVESAKQYSAQAAKEGVPTNPNPQSNVPAPNVPATPTSPVTGTTQSAKSQDLAQGLKNVQAEVGRLNGLGIPLGWTCDPIPSDDDVAKATKAAQSAATCLHDAQSELDKATKAAAEDKTNDPARQASLIKARLEFQIAEKKSSKAHADLEEKVTKHVNGQSGPRDDDWDYFWHSDRLFFWTKIFGLLLSAFAASLGAPFWFDVLNKFMSVRGSGKAPEEKPKDPKLVLKPTQPEGGPGEG